MDFILGLVVAFFIFLLILPIGVAASNFVGGALYWAENGKRKNYEDTDDTR